MHDKKRNQRRKNMIAVTIILVVISILTLLLNTSLPGSQIVRDTVSNVEYYVIKAPLSYVHNVFKEYNDLKKVYRENQRLKRSLDNYARELARNNVLEEELKQLKEITGTSSLTTEYKVKYTSVIQRDAENWSSQITINIGANSDVKVGMAVMTSKGIIGTVTKTTAISSTVILLTSEYNPRQLPVMIKSDDKIYYGLLNSYNVKEKAYKITMLSTVDTIKAGAICTTSGLGGEGKAPKGILVGTVTGFSSGDNASGKIATVKPSADFESLNYVAVVQRSK